MYKDLGKDWVDEWLWRANKDLWVEDRLGDSEMDEREQYIWDYENRPPSRSWSSLSSSDSEDNVSTPLETSTATVLEQDTIIGALKDEYLTSIGHDATLMARLKVAGEDQKKDQMVLWHESQEPWRQRRSMEFTRNKYPACSAVCQDVVVLIWRYSVYIVEDMVYNILLEDLAKCHERRRSNKTWSPSNCASPFCQIHFNCQARTCLVASSSCQSPHIHIQCRAPRHQL
jgi:hypothetical protein